MNPEVFALSAGYAPEHDYGWKSEGGTRVTSDVRERFDWLDDMHPSILVEQASAENFSVLVAGFTTERRDYKGRVLRNAIFWQSLSPNAARSLTIKFLRTRDALSTQCNAAITSKDDAPGGYAVNWQALQTIAAPVRTSAPTPTKTADARCLERPLTETEMKATADLIAESDWPKSPGVLLVVSRLPASSALRDLRERPVWRFHHEQAVSQELPPKALPRPQPGPPIPRSQPDNKFVTWFAALLIVLFVGWILLPKKKTDDIPTHSEGQPAGTSVPPLSAEQMEKLVKDAITETGAKTSADLEAVVKRATELAAGAASKESLRTAAEKLLPATP